MSTPLSPHTFTLTRTIQTSPHAVYRAFTTGGGVLDWLANSSDVDARVGGRLYLWDEKGGLVIGKFTHLEKDQTVAFDLAVPSPGQVDVTILAEEPANAERSVLLTFQYRQLETDKILESPQPWWENALDNLQTVLETGLDRRLYARPMMGILISGMVDADAQERLNLPLDYGILVGGTLPAMGAETAGMLEGDVLFEMDHQLIRDYYALAQVIAPHQAGDTIHVAWFRGKDRHDADLILSGRPHPQIPATLAELAEEARQIYARLDGELAEMLDGITEQAAEYRPAETEWNTKEILAHLINTERSMQIWVINIAEGTQFNNWASNNHHLVKSIVDIYPTLPLLLAELRRAEAQTVALLQRLPEEIVTHKGTFHNIVTTLNKEGLSVHTRLHFETIKKLIEEGMK